MPDRDKVIEGLECVIRKMEGGVHVCDDCPYDEDFNCLGCVIALRQAIALLREQEPVKPYMGHSIQESRIHFRCGACQQAIDREDRFCRSCGKEVAWDD